MPITLIHFTLRLVPAYYQKALLARALGLSVQDVRLLFEAVRDAAERLDRALTAQAARHAEGAVVVVVGVEHQLVEHRR